jgi:hypothetical protein
MHRFATTLKLMPVLAISLVAPGACNSQSSSPDSGGLVLPKWDGSAALGTGGSLGSDTSDSCTTFESCTRGSSESCSSFTCSGASTSNAAKDIRTGARTCTRAGAASVTCTAYFCTIAGQESGTFECNGSATCFHEWGGGSVKCPSGTDDAGQPRDAAPSKTCRTVPASNAEIFVGWSISNQCTASVCADNGVASIKFSVRDQSTQAVLGTTTFPCNATFEQSLGHRPDVDVVISAFALDAHGAQVSGTATFYMPARYTAGVRFDFSNLGSDPHGDRG